MRRSDLIANLRVAGYHGDQQAFVRLLVENRIARKAAYEAYQIGQKQRQGGMKCYCHRCNKLSA